MNNLTHLSDLDMLEAAHRRISGSAGSAVQAQPDLRDQLRGARRAARAPRAGRRRHAAYKMIMVQSHRRVSDTVSQRLGIRHETPQAILLRAAPGVDRLALPDHRRRDRAGSFES